MKTKINFTIDKMSILCNIMNGEVKARLDSKHNPEKKRIYKKMGVIDTSYAITKFMYNHPNVFGNKKLIKKKGNIFEEMLPISSDNGKSTYIEEVNKLIKYTYDLSETEKKDFNSFLLDFWNLSADNEIKEIIKTTKIYKDSIEKIWKANEDFALKCVHDIVDLELVPVGTVCTYIMYPSFNIHRTCISKSNQINLFFGKMKETNPNKIVAYLTHQVVHQPMLPYKSTMTKKQKEVFHAFIKFLTDKEVYYRLTGKSGLDIVTQNEIPEAMAKVYPYWLGYKFRNAEQNGKNPEREILKTIQRDKKYYDRLLEKSKKRQLYKGYEFEKLDPLKIASYFKEKRGITPYQFYKIDFDNKNYVYKDEYLSKAM